MPSNRRILTINGGSSSIKFAVFETDDADDADDIDASLKQILSGAIEKIGTPCSVLRIESSSQPVNAPDHSAAVSALMSWIEKGSGLDAITAIAHRVVHGGTEYSEPLLITAKVIENLLHLSALDPEHLPEEILLAETLHRRFPYLPQVACFDTAFHRDMPRVAQLLPIPRRFEAKGVRRYGFHGLSYSFLIKELNRLSGTEQSNSRVVLAHLGHGASLAAVRDGKSVDTSMGFTPASGVSMGTRSGDLDPGLVGYLSRTEGIDATQFNEMAGFQSGLLGVSETSSDMKELLEHEPLDVRAAEAIALFCYQIKKCIGAFAAVLGGLDTLVFTGGIGENAPIVRSRICAGLEFLGIEIEEERNALNESVVSKKNHRGVIVRVIHTDEERMMAEMVCRVLDGKVTETHKAKGLLDVDQGRDTQRL